VVISGIGLTTALGTGREETWRALLAGGRAVRRVSGDELRRRDPVSPWPRNVVAAPAALLQAEDGGDPLLRLASRAAAEAVADARLGECGLRRERMGCVVGVSKGSLHALPSRWREFLPSTPAAVIASEYGLRGAALAPVAACTTGLVSVVRGYELVRDGDCDLVLAGSVDASLQPLLLATYRRMNVLATASDDPAAACRPFDRDRSGFALGEGAAVLVLEREETAVARGVTPYAEFLAGGLACDPTGMTALDPSAADLAWLTGDVLRRAGLSPSQVDYVNLHGTATRTNDVAETRAVRAAFGPAADRVPCSSLKGALGHLLAAAGSAELACCALALRDQVVPPTANLSRPDPECDLDYVPNAPRPAALGHVLKLSLGFGGHLAAAVLRRWT
jgi:3-oxoacyl-[acyl-carrier-protein] synthase II